MFTFGMCAQVAARPLTSWERWAQRPQRLWIRRALFQIHLWVGLGIGLYVIAISISGSALVLRQELTRRSLRHAVITGASRQAMSVEEVTQQAQRAYPTYEVDYVVDPDAPGQPDHVVLERGTQRIERLFDPYTGLDLGDARSWLERTFEWLADLHDNLLARRSGRFVNGIAACFVTLLSLTGAILWWPGIKNWRRSTTVKWKASFPRLNWDLHSALGFWCWFFVLVWGISGIYLCFPALTFSPRIHAIGGSFLALLVALHFGRFDGLTKALWTAVGLVPAALAVTGALMWWNRVLGKKFRRPYRQTEIVARSKGLVAVRN